MDYPNLLKLLLSVVFVKLLSSHPIHIVVWRNFPFKLFIIFALSFILKTLFNIVEERLKKLLNFDVSAV